MFTFLLNLLSCVYHYLDQQKFLPIRVENIHYTYKSIITKYRKHGLLCIVKNPKKNCMQRFYICFYDIYMLFIICEIGNTCFFTNSKDLQEKRPVRFQVLLRILS